MQSNQEPVKIEELPSRATKHKQQQVKRFKLGWSWPKRKQSDAVEMSTEKMVLKPQAETETAVMDEAETPREIAFYEALQSVREQASATAVAAAPPVPVEEKRRWRLPPLQVIMGGLLGLSLLANIGEGFVIYKVMKLYAAEKNRYAVPQEVMVQPAPEKEVSPVRQAVTWDEPQRTLLSKQERTEIESRLSALLTPDVMQNGALNFVYVPGLNHLSAKHDGGVAFSAFFHNGFMKGYLPDQIRIKATYEGTVVLERTFQGKYAEWAPSDVRLIEFGFSFDDVRDSKVLDELLKDTEKQQKIKFDVMMAYEKVRFPTQPDLTENVWVYLNPHTLAEKPAVQ